MKILYVMADGDYDAVRFEDVYGTVPDVKLWNRVREGEDLLDNDGYELQIKALDFKDVDPNFVGFVKATLIDEEYAKHSNFYVVKE